MTTMNRTIQRGALVLACLSLITAGAAQAGRDDYNARGCRGGDCNRSDSHRCGGGRHDNDDADRARRDEERRREEDRRGQGSGSYGFKTVPAK